jgi:hypothetical protein
MDDNTAQMSGQSVDNTANNSLPYTIPSDCVLVKTQDGQECLIPRFMIGYGQHMHQSHLNREAMGVTNAHGGVSVHFDYMGSLVSPILSLHYCCSTAGTLHRLTAGPALSFPGRPFARTHCRVGTLHGLIAGSALCTDSLPGRHFAQHSSLAWDFMAAFTANTISSVPFMIFLLRWFLT